MTTPLTTQDLELITSTVSMAHTLGLPLHEYVAKDIEGRSASITHALSREVDARRLGKTKQASAYAKQAGRLMANQDRMTALRRRFASWQPPTIDTNTFVHKVY
jgi:hypothetical protein